MADPDIDVDVEVEVEVEVDREELEIEVGDTTAAEAELDADGLTVEADVAITGVESADEPDDSGDPHDEQPGGIE